MFRQKKRLVIGKKMGIGGVMLFIAVISAENFTTKDALFVHEGDLSTCWSYTEVPGESYRVKTGQHWVVEEPAQEEQGHWEYR